LSRVDVVLGGLKIAASDDELIGGKVILASDDAEVIRGGGGASDA
jgi:hypothetical protein